MVTVGKTQGMRRCANLLPTVKQEGIFVTESIPYDLKYFLQDIGIIEVLQVVEKVETETYNVWLPSNTDDEPPFQEKKMYRVTIYKDKRLIATFLEDLMSVAVGKAHRIGNKNDEVYIHEVIESADGFVDELECVLKYTLGN